MSKPDHTTAYGGLLLAFVAFVAGIFMLSESEPLELGHYVGQSLIVGGVIGAFVMVGAMAVVGAIYRRTDDPE